MRRRIEVPNRFRGVALVLAATTAAAYAVAFASAAVVDRSSTGKLSAQPSKIVIGGTVAPPGLDVTAQASAATQQVLQDNVYEKLVTLNPKGQLVPALATSWTVSPSGTVYTFKIRRGVRFSNGDPLVAGNIAFSLGRVVAPGSTYPRKADFGSLKSAHSVGKYKLVVTLKNPDQSWLYAVATTMNGVVLNPRTIPDLATKTVGTGPYVVSSFVPNQSVTLKWNPYYWGPKPPIKEVVWRYYSNPSALNAAELSGQVDVIQNEPVAQSLGQFSRARFRVLVGRTASKADLIINNGRGPLSNVLVRRAITMAIDKAAINKAVTGGYGIVLGSESTPFDPYYTDLTKLYPFNPVKAKALLAQAGYPNGFSVTLTLPPYPYAIISGPLVAAELEAIGISVNIRNVEWPLWLTSVFGQKQYDLTIVEFPLPRTVGNFANPAYFFNYGSANRIAGILAKGNQSTTTAGRDKYYRQALKAIAYDAAAVWLYSPPQLTVARKGIIGLPGGSPSQTYNVSHLQVGGTLSADLKAAGYR